LNWTYDKIYRLTNEAVSNDPANKNGSVNYLLDPVGNRKSSTSTLSGVTPESFTYTVDDELTTDLYDNNGNTTVSGANSFTYDSENELKTMNGGAVTLLYDGDGNRVAKTVGGVTTRYLVDDVNPTGLPQVVEETVNGVVQRQYSYGLQLISESQFVNNAWTPSFYETDGTGSVRQLTNSAGQITDTYDYDAFGNEVNSTGTTPNNYLYRGEQYDADLGLYYLRARYYNPTNGRFLNVDPQASEGQRRYQYAAADPVNGMDPTGNEALTEFLLLQFRPLPIMSWPNWCGYVRGTWFEKYFPSCTVPPQPSGPPRPCSKTDPKCNKYILNVIFDTGGTSRDMNSGETGNLWDVRAVNYSLELAPPPGVAFGPQPNFTSVSITEHQSNAALTVGNGTESGTGLFQDSIGPHGKRINSGIIHSDRYFTVVLDGDQLGQVPIKDRFGMHSTDSIDINNQQDTTRLNGHLDQTDTLR
jgi:RHS repeat-associated protein